LAEAEDILISLHKKYVVQMLQGQKTIELRRRTVRVSRGTRVWIYSKAPHAVVEVLAIVDRVVSAPPEQLWNDYKDQLGISKAEFESYFLDASLGCALVLRDIERLPSSIALAEIRHRSSSFQPPQFFIRFRSNDPALKFLRMKCKLQPSAPRDARAQSARK
jgi:predicted transcriptional regulator